MKKEDLDALASLYEGVYSSAESGEYLSEEYLEENPKYRTLANDLLDAIGSGLKRIPGAVTKPRPGLDSAMNKPRGVNQKPAAKPTQSALAGRVSSTNDIASLRRGQEQARLNQLAAASRNQGGNTPPPKPTSLGAGTPAAKVAPTAAAKPAGQTGDKAKDMATWAKANSTLSSASAEKARIRGTQQTDNPLMKDMKSRLPMNSPSVQSPMVSNLGKGNQSLVNNPNALKAATPKPSSTPKKPMTQTQSFEWPSVKTIRDIADAYASIYEAKKKDQDQDGDTDFADVQIARMMASGMSRAEAIAAVRNKEYNEEYELDEATRMRKELGKKGEIRVRRELAARSRAYNRSGSVDKTIAAAERGADRPYVKFERDESDADRKKREEKQSRTLRRLASSRRGSVRDRPRVQLRGYAAKVEGDDKELQTSRQKAMSAGTLTPKEKKQLGEEYQIYEIVASYLLENNFAETLNDANVIIENMSENWLEEILNNYN